MRSDLRRTNSTATALLALVILVACAGPAAPTDASDTAESSSAASTASADVASAAASEPQGVSASPEGATGGPLGEAESCSNDDIGFAVEYPGGWWANEEIDLEDPASTPIPACTYFAPQAVELVPNTGLPPGIAIWFDHESQFEVTGDVVSQEETTIDGRPAFAVETVATGSSGFEMEGTRTYRYIIDMGDGSEVLAATSTQYIAEADYEEAMPILDAMMETLDFEED